MNNRNPNKENTYSNLAAWCEKYHKDSGIKIHPSSVPVDLVLEDLMGYIAHLNAGRVQLIGALDHAVARLDQIEKDLLDCKVQLLELQNPIVEIKPETKKVKK